MVLPSVAGKPIPPVFLLQECLSLLVVDADAFVEIEPDLRAPDAHEIEFGDVVACDSGIPWDAGYGPDRLTGHLSEDRELRQEAGVTPVLREPWNDEEVACPRGSDIEKTYQFSLMSELLELERLGKSSRAELVLFPSDTEIDAPSLAVDDYSFAPVPVSSEVSQHRDGEFESLRLVNRQKMNEVVALLGER